MTNIVMNLSPEAHVGYINPDPTLDMDGSILCRDCANKMPKLPETKLWPENLHPYSQYCSRCETLIYDGPASTVLFGTAPTQVNIQHECGECGECDETGDLHVNCHTAVRYALAHISRVTGWSVDYNGKVVMVVRNTCHVCKTTGE